MVTSAEVNEYLYRNAFYYRESIETQAEKILEDLEKSPAWVPVELLRRGMRLGELYAALERLEVAGMVERKTRWVGRRRGSPVKTFYRRRYEEESQEPQAGGVREEERQVSQG